jgi:hypothetical protein
MTRSAHIAIEDLKLQRLDGIAYGIALRRNDRAWSDPGPEQQRPFENLLHDLN